MNRSARAIALLIAFAGLVVPAARAAVDDPNARRLQNAVPAVVANSQALYLNRHRGDDPIGITVTLGYGAKQPTAADEQRVLLWLQANGFHTTATYPSHAIVGATGTFVLAERMFDVALNNYAAWFGCRSYRFYAPDKPLRIDAYVSGIVLGISGLDDVPSSYWSGPAITGCPPMQRLLKALTQPR